MGFFSRQDTTSQRGQAAQNEQLLELRRRARRRLIGALVIVLIAVIFVPLLLKSDGAEEVEQVVQVFPPIVAPQSEPELEQTPWADDDFAAVQDPDSPGAEGPLTDNEGFGSAVVDAAQQSAETLDEVITELEQAPAETTTAATEQTRADSDRAQQETTQQTKPVNEPERTDDGSVALALLEGRMDPDELSSSQRQQPAAQKGSFTVQVAAYSSSESAQSRREQLASAGVNNAFIESGASANGTTYRLRVGPFESRQAAEAALTRLRSLGYDDSFIRSQ